MDGTNGAENSSGQKGVELNCALPSIELAAGGAEYILELNFFSPKFLPQVAQAVAKDGCWKAFC